MGGEKVNGAPCVCVGVRAEDVLYVFGSVSSRGSGGLVSAFAATCFVAEQGGRGVEDLIVRARKELDEEGWDAVRSRSVLAADQAAGPSAG